MRFVPDRSFRIFLDLPYPKAISSTELQFIPQVYT